MNRRTMLSIMLGGGAGLMARLGERTAFAAGKAKVVTIVDFSDAGMRLGEKQVEKISKSDAEWKRQLSAGSFDVTRREGTERAFTGSTWNLHDKGIYRCICCDTPVFNSDTKFESNTGWPSFWQPIDKHNVDEKIDMSLGIERTAVACKVCDAHLGHVFDDGPRPTGLRYCMNSAAMRFAKA
jgi:peptide-methionine (R)-S-oxide reductase